MGAEAELLHKLNTDCSMAILRKLHMGGPGISMAAKVVWEVFFFFWFFLSV